MAIVRQYKLKCENCGIESDVIHTVNNDIPESFSEYDIPNIVLPIGWLVFNDHARNSYESYSRWGARASINRYFHSTHCADEWYRKMIAGYVTYKSSTTSL